MLRLRHIMLLCAALLALAAPTAALADGDDVIRDCYEDGKLDREYSQGELKEAEEDLPSDVDEYSDCRAVIAAARKRGDKKGGGTGGVPGAGFRGGGTSGSDPALSTSSGAQAASSEDLEALNQVTARSGGAEPEVPVSGQPITPAAGAASVDESANDMPTPLLAALIAVGALGALGGAFAAWRRRPQLLRRGPLRFGRG